MPNDNDNSDQQQKDGADNQSQSQQQQQQQQQDSQTKTFMDMLDPDLKQNPSISKFKDVKDLAKSYVELQKLVGSDKVKVPNEKSSPEEWKAFFRKVGAPEKEDDYDVSDDDVPEALRTDAATKAEFRKRMLGEGYTKKQFDAAWKFYKESTVARYNQEVEQSKKIRSDAETTLRKEWGQAYEVKVDKAQQFINKFFKGKEIHPAFQMLSSSTGFVKAMAEAAEAMGEDTLSGGRRTTMTPTEAQAEINAMMGDPKHPLHSDMHPEHTAAVDRLLELRTLAESGS